MDNLDVYALVIEHECTRKRLRLLSETITSIQLLNHNLSDAEFYSCVFDGVYFENVKLDRASIGDCLFVNCMFINVTFVDAFISSSFFTSCSFRDSDLDKARRHEFGYCNLVIQNEGLSDCSCIRMACPEEGSFIAWKKVAYAAPFTSLLGQSYTGIRYALVKLQIPDEAARSSAGSRKCRCEYADVLDIEDIESGIKLKRVNNYDHPITYTKGERVYPDSFDTDRWNECSHGIHFFMSKQDALEYVIC